MGRRAMVLCEVFAHVPVESHVIRPIVSSTLSFLGASPTLGTGTTTGVDSTVVWSGTASSRLPSQTLNPWGN
ncbi:hypothetical protein AVEN_262356-1, partial [Araneus ventricosus]